MILAGQVSMLGLQTRIIPSQRRAYGDDASATSVAVQD